MTDPHADPGQTDGVVPVPRISAFVVAGGPVILLLAALVPEQRPVGVIALGLGWVALRLGRRPDAIARTAMLPVAIALAWPLVAGGDLPLGAACTDPLSPIVLRRLGLAVIVSAAIGALAVVHRSTLEELGLGRPRTRDLGIAIGACIGLASGGLLFGAVIAKPFFGNLEFAITPAALVPAVIFGIANGVMEELQYRGAMQGWLGRIAPRWLAIGYPALVFGLVHAGTAVVALLAVHVALLAAVGAAGGIVRARTGSLAIPIGVHVGADIALYIGLACRAAAG